MTVNIKVETNDYGGHKWFFLEIENGASFCRIRDDSNEIQLDGWFSSEQLRAIADWIDAKP